MARLKAQYTVSEASQSLDKIVARAQTGERVVAYVVPSVPINRVGCMKDSITILGDLTSPDEKWDVEQ